LYAPLSGHALRLYAFAAGGAGAGAGGECAALQVAAGHAGVVRLPASARDSTAFGILLTLAAPADPAAPAARRPREPRRVRLFAKDEGSRQKWLQRLRLCAAKPQTLAKLRRFRRPPGEGAPGRLPAARARARRAAWRARRAVCRRLSACGQSGVRPAVRRGAQQLRRSLPRLRRRPRWRSAHGVSRCRRACRCPRAAARGAAHGHRARLQLQLYGQLQRVVGRGARGVCAALM
jgi:hypothetical protein